MMAGNSQPEPDHDLVWYVAYGSNLLRERFLAYIVGGSGPGRSVSHDGSKDKTLPRDDRPLTIERRLIFTGESQLWAGGGVCAVVPGQDSTCLGRGWLISSDQLLDVWRQENGGREVPRISWPDLSAEGRLDVGDGRYRRLDWLGEIDGRPAVTITCGEEMLSAVNQPALDYLVTVGHGLQETWSLDTDAVVDYLASATAGPDGESSTDSSRLRAALA